MNKSTFKKSLTSGVVWVSFQKKDGSLREMFCTLHPQYVIPYEKKTDRVRSPKEGMISVWDIENDGFRTINISNIKDWSEVLVLDLNTLS